MSPVPSSSAAASTSSNASSGAVTSATASQDENMFLQLLVAQLQNQDPLNPMDSSTFVTQLAQFQQLQSTVGMASDISDIRSDADQLLTDYQGTGTTSNGASQTTQS
jgi:flagellar basal-body rod modification protein FlgD